jgi:hypothetical protein
MIIKAETLLEAFDRETAMSCGHEERVGIFSMSSLYLSEQEILQRIKDGVEMNERQRLKLYLGTHCEKGIRERLEAVCSKDFGRWIPPRLVTAFNGRLTGHIDGGIDKALVEIKTVPNEAVLSEMKLRRTIPFKVEAQINSYMLWGPFERTLLIYEERENGTHWISEHFPNKNLQRDLHFKAKYILDALDAGQSGVKTFRKITKLSIKELRHVILRELKTRAAGGKRAELSFSELWRICAAAGPGLSIPVNADTQSETFTKTFFDNINFLETTDLIGIIAKENDEKIESIFLTKFGEEYVGSVEFK